MTEIVRSLPDTSKPLCPNSLEPVHQAHQLRNRILDAFCEAAEKGADGDMVEPAGRAYQAAAYERVGDSMELYRHSASFLDGGDTYTVVESFWRRCGVCGLVLPAGDEALPARRKAHPAPEGALWIKETHEWFLSRN